MKVDKGMMENPDMTYFSEDEKEILEYVYQRFKKETPTQISENKSSWGCMEEIPEQRQAYQFWNGFLAESNLKEDTLIQK